MTRRAWVQGLAVLVLGGIGVFNRAWAEAQKKKLIDMSKKDPADKINEAAVAIASGLTYVANAKQAVADGTFKRVEKAGVAPDLQICATCEFHTSVEENKSGECKLIQGVLIHDAGGCISWMKKTKLAMGDLKGVVDKAEAAAGGTKKPAGGKKAKS